MTGSGSVRNESRRLQFGNTIGAVETRPGRAALRLQEPSLIGASKLVSAFSGCRAAALSL
jgi:hypothetical protein